MFLLNTFDTIVIGAGSAGLIAAGKAAENGNSVLVLEKMKAAGRKLLITGKGRCNITNIASMDNFYKSIHPKGRFLKHAFSAFFSRDIIDLLDKYGVKSVVERGGRVFPESNRSSDVLNALLEFAGKQGAKFLYNHRVKELLVKDGSIYGIVAESKGENKVFHTRKVILCTGGCSYPATGSSGDGYRLAAKTGHTIVNLRPSLVPVDTEGKRAELLQGLSLKNVKATVTVNNKKLKEAFGEMLFTHFGLSGPIILTLSRIMVDELNNKHDVYVSIDLKPALDESVLDRRLLRDINEHGKKQIKHIFKFWLPGKLIPFFLQELNIDGEKQGHQLRSEERRRILMLMKDLQFKVKAYRSFKEAIITAGGVSTDEIVSKTMESKLIKNLFFAGEVIDLDAETGGYNLQIAFSTGWLAGKAAGKAEEKQAIKHFSA